MDQICPRNGSPCTGDRLHTVPIKGDAGAEILSRVCTTCWGEWKDFQVKVINEYRIRSYEPKDREILRQQMRKFLNLDGDGGEMEPLPTEQELDKSP